MGIEINYRVLIDIAGLVVGFLVMLFGGKAISAIKTRLQSLSSGDISPPTVDDGVAVDISPEKVDGGPVNQRTQSLINACEVIMKASEDANNATRWQYALAGMDEMQVMKAEAKRMSEELGKLRVKP